jgi:DnaJ-class molecular chaperone
MKDYDKPKCIECQGTGACPMCDGFGTVETGRTIPQGAPALAECDTCDGSGECLYCNGTGNQE